MLSKLDQLPRYILQEEPTPIECLKNLSRHLHTRNLYVKRDDCNRLGFGGNKVRQLEFYFGEALSENADTVLITGAIQSNFVRLTAAFAARVGLNCHVQLESRVANPSENYLTSGNVLLNRLFGATLHYYSEGENEIEADNRLRVLAQRLKANGSRPYIIPLAPGHKPVGALGYIVAAQELLRQLEQLDIEISTVFVASGSGNTHAGFLFGLRALGSKMKVVGVCVRRNHKLQWTRIQGRCQQIADLLEVSTPVKSSDIVLTDTFLAPGYGVASKKVWDSILLFARKEGLVLDPAYTGKTGAAFLDHVRKETPQTQSMFIHTGGTPALFAYRQELERAIAMNEPNG